MLSQLKTLVDGIGIGYLLYSLHYSMGYVGHTCMSHLKLGNNKIKLRKNTMFPPFVSG